MRIAAILFSLLAVSACTRSKERPEPAKPAAATNEACAEIDHRHGAWTAFLGRYVRGGEVDYAAWHKTGRDGLAAYLRSLEAVCTQAEARWTREQKLAFWINAYNAYTVKVILDHYPVKSIKDIGEKPFAVFDRKWIPMAALRRRVLSLNDIEHEILRKELKEPRIHFALVCASKSCPSLRAQAYRPDDLERQLEDSTRAFLRDPRRNRVDASGKRLQLSSIFQWFREDFDRAAGSAQAFVARYLEGEAARLAKDPTTKVEFLEYDWSLNGR